MERRKKYIWGCVLCALLTAVLIGMIYYYNDVRGTDQVSEGTQRGKEYRGERTKCDIGRYPDNGMQQFFHHEQD